MLAIIKPHIILDFGSSVGMTRKDIDTLLGFSNTE